MSSIVWRSVLDLDNRIMSSAHAGAATLVGPIWNPRFESSIFVSRRLPLDLNNSVEDIPPCRTPVP